MRPFITNSAVTYCLLALAGGASLMLPDRLSVGLASGAAAPSSPNVIHLNGVVRNFHPANTDFKVTQQSAPGTYVNLVQPAIGPGGVPVYSGSGNKVTTPAVDASGREIAPVMSNPQATLGVNFQINAGKVIPTETFAAQFTILGTAFENLPITVQLHVGAQTINPFGSFTNPALGNVDDGKNPRKYVLPSTYPAGTVLSIIGQSWLKNGSSYTKIMTDDSNVNSPAVKVLRKGNTVPNIKPFGTQGTIASFLNGLFDPVTKKVTIADNQVIYLFELYSLDPNLATTDYQDLVILLTMAKTPAAIVPAVAPPVSACGPTNDTPAKLDPTSSTGAITSASTFAQWFSDVPGVNLSSVSPFDLTKQVDGSYMFDAKTDPYYSKLGGFYPADNLLFGTKSASGHNDPFTYQFHAYFTYTAAMQQYFQTLTDSEVWVFINDKLVIDMGGFHSATQQRIDLSRLCLTEGKKYKLSFFMAHRYAPESAMKIQTNIPFEGVTQQVVFSPSD